MSDSISNNKRVAKNTIFLYFRMILLLSVSLYTSRVVLSTLGFEDFGIYNVVAGIVTMFSFINLALANSTSRYITYALGKGNISNSRSVFTSCFITHVIIALVIVILSETIGLWFLLNKMVIPESRMYAATWVYQISVISCVVSILYVPFNAMIIAHEKMSTFAFMSIIDALLKLAIVYVITISYYDKLIIYSCLLLAVSMLNIVFYFLYCKRNFLETKFVSIKHNNYLREILSFAGWSMIGNLAYVGYTQGINVLLNIFFGPLINAARGIATQLQGAIMGFVTNFQMAVNPQITKSYALKDYDRLNTLIFASSRFSFYLLYCIVLPISLKSNLILKLWLSDVPEYAVKFTILTLFARLIDTLSNPICIANNATGEIRTFQIWEGGSLLMIVPISYIVLICGGNPVSVFWVQIIVMYMTQLLRMYLVCKKIKMSISTYCNKVLCKIISVTLLSSIVPVSLNLYFEENLVTGMLIIIISIISVLVSAYLIGLEKGERIIINQKISGFLKASFTI